MLLEQIIDFRKDLDLHVFITDFLDHPFGHFGMRFQQPALKITETIGFTGKVINQAGNTSCTAIITRHDIQGGQADLLGKITLLQRLGFEAGQVERSQ